MYFLLSARWSSRGSVWILKERGTGSSKRRRGKVRYQIENTWTRFVHFCHLVTNAFGFHAQMESRRYQAGWPLQAQRRCSMAMSMTTQGTRTWQIATIRLHCWWMRMVRRTQSPPTVLSLEATDSFWRSSSRTAAQLQWTLRQEFPLTGLAGRLWARQEGDPKPNPPPPLCRGVGGTQAL